MDWFVDASNHQRLSELRHEIGDYLRRHATDPDSVDIAEVVIAELLGNVVRHAAGPAWVSLDWSQIHPVFTVRDLGPGLELDPKLPDCLEAESGRGLYLASQLARGISAAVRAAGGASVSAELAVERRTSQSIDPPRRSGVRLPRPQEAESGVGFGREAFLRALVVEVAQAVEQSHGPAAAEAVVAQAGIDIGTQMEAEYRDHSLVGEALSLSTEQIADCFVRLKQAIGGGFSVLEIDDDRIVLGNTRCPFGDVVKMAPALCRMTSAVFGGIAASNAEREAFVVLEERIAVGDPACRVAVYLDRPPPDPRIAHRYLAPAVEPVQVRPYTPQRSAAPAERPADGPASDGPTAVS